MKAILIVGGGSIGERHLRCFLKTRRAQVSLCDTNSKLCERLNESYSIQSTFSSLEDALQNEFDAAVICTPAHLHITLAQQVVDQGIAVLIEKPLSTTTKGVDDLIRTVSNQGISASVAYVNRAHPALIDMKHKIDSGRFGQPVQFVMTSGQNFPFYRPAYQETYYTRHETGGGAIQDALTHSLNAAEWLVGPITKLVADAEHCLLEGVDIEDTVNILTRHSNVLGSFSLNQHQAPNESTFTVVCERGTVRYEAHNARWLSCVEPGSEWFIENEFRIERDELFYKQANAFLDLLDHQQLPACTLLEGLQTLKVNLAALQSVKTCQWVTI